MTACPAERCPSESDPARHDGYCSCECARTNALITPPRGLPRPRPPAPFDPTRECGACHGWVLRVHGPGPGTVRLVDAEPRPGGRLILRGDQVIAELRGQRMAGWGDAAFAVHECPVTRELERR